jgi:amidohydrolase
MLDKAHKITGEIVSWRRDFHMHPELGFQEIRTSARVAEIAASLGGHIRRGVGRTGVVVELGEGSPVIALRADMDALPLQEANKNEYRSENAAIMHACGHDCHTAMMLGAIFCWVKKNFLEQYGFFFSLPRKLGMRKVSVGHPE